MEDIVVLYCTIKEVVASIDMNYKMVSHDPKIQLDELCSMCKRLINAHLSLVHMLVHILCTMFLCCLATTN